MSGQDDNNNITLELGDIIQIHSPTNPELHDETFFIFYLDETKIKITNISTFLPHTLKLDEEGHITDESIRNIYLLNRSNERGYARQHLLLPKTWIDLHFGGEVPTIITGEITNLEEDMIEITTFPDLEVIYVDFAYKGMPEEYPLDKINIRAKPASLEKIASLVGLREEGMEPEEMENIETVDAESTIEYTETGESILRHPKDVQRKPSFRETLHTLYSTSGIVYGEELEEIVQRVEIPEYQKRYGIETQANDMLDELLSEIPNIRRTKPVLDNIHLLIERFRELRNDFSTFDSNGNVIDAYKTDSSFKPMAEQLSKALNSHHKWILPVTAIRRKIYTSEDPETISDVLKTDLGEILRDDETTQNNYFKNRQRIGDVPSYLGYYSKIHDSMKPFEEPAFPETHFAPERDITEDLDTILQNQENFQSTAYVTSKDIKGYARRRFVIQRYNLGMTHLASKMSKEGRRVYIRSSMTPSDKATVGSFLVLPKPAFKMANINLPQTSILDKSSLAQNPLYIFRLLQNRTEIIPNIIDNFDGERENGDFIHPHKVQEFSLDENLENDPHRYRRFLDTMIPKTTDLIETMIKENPYSLSIKAVIDTLEPFGIYSNDITYSQYNKIRYFIKQSRKDFLARVEDRGKELAFWRNATYPFSVKSSSEINAVENMFFEKRELRDILTDIYDIATKGNMMVDGSESLSKILELDNGKILAILLQIMLISLVTPERLIKPSSTDESDDMSNIETIKARDCTRRVLTKRYLSIKDMQKDNSEPDVYYDQEFDDTPYGILKKYSAEKSKYSPKDYVEFVAENLIAKHDCPPKIAKEMAEDMIAGKKRVREGEYAIVEIRPHLPAGADADKQEIESEINLRKKTQYYRRVRQVWVHDDSIDEAAFIDTNALFCNMDKRCTSASIEKGINSCESIPDAQTRMRLIARKKMLEEFDQRYVESVEGLQEFLKSQLTKELRDALSKKRLNRAMAYKANYLAYELGRFAKGTDDITQSPHTELCSLILGQDDFVKRQSDIIRFVDLYCRDPMVAELGENPYILYCKETNLPLLPTFLRDLASTFVSGDNYVRKVAEICRKQGLKSEDGDAWVDRYTGKEICKIDFVQDEMFDDAGYKIITSEIMEKDARDELVTLIGEATNSNAKKKDRVFENELAETVYNVFVTISTNIHLSMEVVEEFVLRVSIELIDKNAMSEAAYTKMMTKKEQTTGKSQKSYQSYYSELVLGVVAAVILVAIQTTIPSFKIRKTYPGCVQSFTGFPDAEGSESDLTGLKYIACVLNKTKSSIPPWDSIKRMPVDILQARIQKIIREMILPRSDIMELYVKKREYLRLNPEEIPKEHVIQKWTTFMPPVVEFTIIKSLKGLSDGYRQELLEMMRTGNSKQRQQIAMFKTKSVQYGYGIIESIRNIVQSKDLLRKTASNVPFIINACCIERNMVRVLDYFETEDATIKHHVKMVQGWEKILANVREISKAPLLYHPTPTGLSMASGGDKLIGSEHFEENVYLAFIHYCNLDRDLPIPEDLQGLFAEKLPGYDPKATIQEKIEFFNSHGKHRTANNLAHLMEIVNRRNIVPLTINTSTKGSHIRIGGLRDFMRHMEDQSVPVIERPLCKLLDAILNTYDPRTMVMEDSAETRQLNNYLSKANNKMLKTIADFLQTHGNLTSNKFNNLQNMLSKIHIWNMDSSIDTDAMYSIVEFMKNSVFAMSRTYPEMIHNNQMANHSVPKHYEFSENHQRDLSLHIKKYYEELNQFKGDGVLDNLLISIQGHLIDLNLFLEHIPVQSEIVKESETKLSFYSIFSKRTIYMLYTYTWYSVLYEYIMATDDIDLLQTDLRERKKERRETIRENADPLAIQMSESVNTEQDTDDVNELMEIQIVAGNKVELKERVAALLMAYLQIDESNKTAIDYSYTGLSDRVTKSKQDEKKMITDFLRNLDSEERQVENLKKIMKLGRWSVGLQKGIVSYDKNTYDREQHELLLQEIGNGVDMDEDNQMEQGIDDLVEDEVNLADEQGDLEAYDISGLGEDYSDGNYYEEDQGENE